MSEPLSVDVSDLVRWMELEAPECIARGYQGEIFVYEKNGQRFVVKCVSGNFFARFVRARMLRNEFAAYQRLAGFAGSPRCYGLLEGKYLVLEHIAGVSVRHASVSERFHDRLFAFVKELHSRGVAHADLKRKDNLLVVNGEEPCIIDFGVAILRKQGFAPLNHVLFKFACQTDLNAWIKLKYRKRMAEISPADRVHYHRTIVESALREGKRAYKWIKRQLFQRR